MKHKCKLLKYSCIIIIISVIAVQKAISQNTAYYNSVLSYVYQPLQPSLGLTQIYAVNTDGTNNRMIINAQIGLSHQDWSPDTMKFSVAGYVSSSTWSIYTFNSNGTNLVRLTTENNVWDSDPVWSSDMNKIAFTRFYPNQNMKSELWIMNSDGNSQHYIGVEGKFGRWSKDGTKLIYCSKKNNLFTDIYTCDTNGTNEQRLTYSPVDTYMPVYSPDGTEVVYSTGSNNMSDWEIYKMKSDGTGIRKLTFNNASDGHPKWSPDGTMIAFISDRHQSGKPEVYIMDTAGVNVQRVTYSPENITAVNPVWKRSGTTGIKKIKNNVPDNNKLYQNYPNPFNPVTKINFSIAKTGFVSLTVFNALGSVVETLVSKQMNAGSYNVDFDGEGLSGGVYFYRLQTNGFTDIKKLILLK